MSFEEYRMKEHLDYDEERGGCGSTILAVLLIVFLVGYITSLTGCKTVKVGTSHDKDSVRVEYRVDSFTQIVRDSVRIQLPCSDSIEVAYVDRWHTEYKDRTFKIHDTIRVCSTDTIYQPYPVVEYKTKNSGFARFCIWWTIGTWIIILLTLVIWLLKMYIRRA